MPVAEVILQGNGPLPLKGTFNYLSSDVAAVCVSGSAYAPGGAGQLDAVLRIDGVPVGSSFVYTNEPQSHKTFITRFIVVGPFSPGPHVVDLVPAGSTTSDANDFFTVTMIF